MHKVCNGAAKCTHVWLSCTGDAGGITIGRIMVKKETIYIYMVRRMQIGRLKRNGLGIK